MGGDQRAVLIRFLAHVDLAGGKVHAVVGFHSVTHLSILRFREEPCLPPALAFFWNCGSAPSGEREKGRVVEKWGFRRQKHSKPTKRSGISHHFLPIFTIILS